MHYFLHENIFTAAHLISVVLVASGIAIVNTEKSSAGKLGSLGSDKV